MKAGIQSFVFILALIGAVGLYIELGWPWWLPFAALGVMVLFVVVVIAGAFLHNQYMLKYEGKL